MLPKVLHKFFVHNFAYLCSCHYRVYMLYHIRTYGIQRTHRNAPHIPSYVFIKQIWYAAIETNCPTSLIIRIKKKDMIHKAKNQMSHVSILPRTHIIWCIMVTLSALRLSSHVLMEHIWCTAVQTKYHTHPIICAHTSPLTSPVVIIWVFAPNVRIVKVLENALFFLSL